MCGIAGIVYPHSNPDRTEIERMTSVLAHRGPDAFGHRVESNVALGSRRLAILDLSPAGTMPMAREGRYYIIHNGEIYNYIELRRELEMLGHSFSTNTDTEVILAAYRQWGSGCLDRFNGMWAFAVYDREEEKLFCARDRFGVKPFYYAFIAGRFCFASEVKAFTVFPEWRAVANSERLYDFLVSRLMDHTAETMFSGVSQLRGGQYLVMDVRERIPAIRTWYNLSERVKPVTVDATEAAGALRSLLYESVRLRLRSDVRVGSCLSGGLDSSSIVSVMNELLRSEGNEERQESVSACYDDPSADESKFIDAVVAHTSIINHKVFPDAPGLFDVVDRLIWHQDEPFGSTTVSAQWEVFKEAKARGLIVMLDGQGADETLGGYHHYFGPVLGTLLRSFALVSFLRNASALRRIHGYSLKDIAQFAAHALPQGSVRKALKRQTLGDERLWISEASGGDAKAQMKLEDMLFGRCLQEVTSTSLPALLHWEDRNSMAHSVESRLPFLDYRMVEFALSLPDDLKISDGVTKKVLRESVRGIVPDPVVSRMDKKGFTTPERKWLEAGKELLLSDIRTLLDSTNGLLKPPVVDEVERWFAGQSAQDKFFVWRLFALCRWQKVFSVDIRP